MADGGQAKETGLKQAQDFHDLASRTLVAIPALNEQAHIVQCLESLRLGMDEALFHAFEIIVADGGSQDQTVALVEQYAADYPNVRCIENQGRLQSAGVNEVARAGAVGRDILIRCDAHAAYPKGFLKRCLEAWQQHQVSAVVFPMDAVGRGCFQKANAWIVDTRLGSGGSAHRGGQRSGFVDHGHHGIFDRAIFLRLGGYDEEFSHNEDAEFDARLRASGGKIWLDATIRIGYFPRSTMASLWRQYFNYGVGRARNILKNKLRPRFRQMIPLLNIGALVASFFIWPFHPIGALWPVLYGGLLLGSSLWMTIAHRSACGLLSGVALGIIHLAWGIGFLVGCGRYLARGVWR